MDIDVTGTRRPAIHFTAPRNWLNDPNGLIWWEGRYHLFYQHNPDAPEWDRPRWGHATSIDLIRWQDEPIALHPDAPFDEQGCFPGCCVIDDDGMRTWAKHDGPVISMPAPDQRPLTGFRDPFVRRQDDRTWQLVLGSGVPDQGGVVLRYASKDLRNWTDEGVLLDQTKVDDPLAEGKLWECPRLVRLPDRDVLLLSVHDGEPRHVVMVEGHLADGTFTVVRCSRMDDGDSLYAPHAFTTPGGARGRHGLAARGAEQVPATGWSGALSLPRVLTTSARGRRLQRPLETVTSFRVAGNSPTVESAAPPQSHSVVSSRALVVPFDCEWDVRVSQRAQVVVEVRRSGGTELDQALATAVIGPLDQTASPSRSLHAGHAVASSDADHVRRSLLVSLSVSTGEIDDPICQTWPLRRAFEGDARGHA